MIRNLLIYTSEGRLLYSWQWQHAPQSTYDSDNLSLANKLLVSGFFSAINSVSRYIFQSHLQRIVLDNKIIVLSGKELSLESDPKWILVSVLVDLNDDEKLINSLIIQLMDIIAHNLDINDGKYTSNSKLNKLIDECIQKKIYERSKLKVLISSLLIFLTLVAMSFIYAYIRTYKNTIDSSNIVSFSVITLIGLLIIPFSSFSGSKKISSVIGVVCSFFAASVSYWLIEVILKGSHLLGGLGEPYVYFAYYILLGLMFGYLGGLQIERYRLIHPHK